MRSSCKLKLNIIRLRLPEKRQEFSMMELLQAKTLMKYRENKERLPKQDKDLVPPVLRRTLKLQASCQT